MAERVGFEPTVELTPYNGFRELIFTSLSLILLYLNSCKFTTMKIIASVDKYTNRYT